MPTDTKMSYATLGTLIMLKASLDVAIEKMNDEMVYSELRADCHIMKANIESVLNNDWHWG